MKDPGNRNATELKLLKLEEGPQETRKFVNMRIRYNYSSDGIYGCLFNFKQ